MGYYFPIYPFSIDKFNYENIITSLAFYRLNLGQARQEELLNALKALSKREELDDDEIENITTKLMIDLAPFSYNDSSHDNKWYE